MSITRERFEPRTGGPPRRPPDACTSLASASADASSSGETRGRDETGQSSPDPAGARAQLCDARAKKKADLEGGSGGLPEVVSNSILACVLVTPWRPGGWAWCARVDVVSSSSYCEIKLSRRLYPKLYRVVVSSYPSYVRLSILPDENELLAFITCRPPPFPTSHIIASG